MTADDQKRSEAAQTARAYWRLWRRNWRPPFEADDLPAGGPTGTGGAGDDPASASSEDAEPGKGAGR